MNVRNGWSKQRTALDHEIYTPLQSHHIVTGAHCMVSTNSPAVLGAARKFFRQAVEPQYPPGLTLRFWVDPDRAEFPALATALLSRDWSTLAYAGFDSENSFLLDHRRRSVLGRFSPSMARDVGYWQRVIFPALVGLASDALKVTVVHCACVERDGDGLLLAGESGAGKSTLSLAMARCGFAFVSDDWTYLSHADGQLVAWGLGTLLKLLPDAVQHFPELKTLEPGVALNGERSFEVDPEDVFGIRRSPRCEPRWLVFLERQDKTGHTFVRMPPQEAAKRLGSALERLPPESSRLRDIQRATLQSLVERECWILRYGENPGIIAQTLDRFCADSRPKVRTSFAARTQPLLCAKGSRSDKALDSHPARRRSRRLRDAPSGWRPIARPFSSWWSKPSVETTLLSLATEDSAGDSFATMMPGCSRRGRISRVVSADGLEVVNMGQRSFMATDAEARCGVGFLAEELLTDGRRFEKLVLAHLLSLTAGALHWKPRLLPNKKNRYERLESTT